ncbi:hypothetical protein WISP_49220 [Willisornis vidua]|uniref:Uncharacterized protein n=1 Tax=Willisornis vidua TaxID=1566151 RepID=A0ABQ9DE86_9PASS|nr:hypothetical protein WISP_49220 [Willisornis vidua]
MARHYLCFMNVELYFLNVELRNGEQKLKRSHSSVHIRVELRVPQHLIIEVKNTFSPLIILMYLPGEGKANVG